MILALDLSKLSSLNAIAGAVSNIVSRGYPFSMGMVPLVWNEDGKFFLCFNGSLLVDLGG